VLDVAGLVRRTDARHRTHRGDLVRCGENRRAAKGVAHEQSNPAAGLVHEPGRMRDVRNPVREPTIAPVTLGPAESQVVEAQHPDALAGQLLAHPTGSGTVHAECEAVGEHAPPADMALWVVDQTSQPGTARARKPDTLGHVAHPRRPATAVRDGGTNQASDPPGYNRVGQSCHSP
jgi:hypothetical protein